MRCYQLIDLLYPIQTCDVLENCLCKGDIIGHIHLKVKENSEGVIDKLKQEEKQCDFPMQQDIRMYQHQIKRHILR